MTVIATHYITWERGIEYTFFEKVDWGVGVLQGVVGQFIVGRNYSSLIANQPKVGQEALAITRTPATDVCHSGVICTPIMREITIIG